MLRQTIRKLINNFGYDLVKPDSRLVVNGLPADFEKDVVDTYNKVKTYTMTTPERIASLCNAVKYLVDNKIEGDFVECGVWRGGSTMAAIDTLLKAGDKTREIYLYDTYEGMSAPTEADKVFTGTDAGILLDQSDKNDPTSVWCYSA